MTLAQGNDCSRPSTSSTPPLRLRACVCASRYARISTRCRGRRSTKACKNDSVESSAHCTSSTNSTRGHPGWAKTSNTSSKVRLARSSACRAGMFGSSAVTPMTSSASGASSTRSLPRPLSRSTSCSPSVCSSRAGLPSNCVNSDLKICAKGANGISCCNRLLLPLAQ
ncbi:hypothetical protein D3C79_864610 [compost metagenome]